MRNTQVEYEMWRPLILNLTCFKAKETEVNTTMQIEQRGFYSLKSLPLLGSILVNCFTIQFNRGHGFAVFSG
jgi:hypothetical protein